MPSCTARPVTCSIACLTLLIVAAPASRADAQTPPDPAAHTEAVAPPPEDDADDEIFTLSLGATLNFGNSRAIQIAGGTHFMIHRDQSVFNLDLQGTFGSAAARDPVTREFGPFQDNARNILGKMRYDFYLDPDDALFAAIAGRHDTFAGLDFRFQGQIGYLRNVFREGEDDSHRLWGEIGFDVTIDDRYPNPLPNPAADPMTCAVMGAPCTLPNIEDQYSVRVFVGYDNHMSEQWQFKTGLEALFDVVHGDNIRLTSISEFNLRIEDNLQAGLRFTLLFDNVPVPGTDPIDTTTVLNVIYTAL